MLVTAARFTEPWEAHLFRMLLDAEGLFAVVAFEQHATSNYPFAWAIGGVRVMVIEGELEEALAIEKRCCQDEYGAAVDAEFGSTGVPIRIQDYSCWYRVDVLFSCVVTLLLTVIFGVAMPIRPRIKLRA